MEGGADVDVKWRQKSPRPQSELAAEEVAIVAIKIGALYYSEGRTKRSNRTMEFLTLYCISGREREREREDNPAMGRGRRGDQQVGQSQIE